MKKYNSKDGSNEIINQLTEQIVHLKSQIFQLEKIIDYLPGDIYWKDKKGVWQGINNHCIQSLYRMGFIKKIDKNEVVGKTDYDIFNTATADKYRQTDIQVMTTNQEIIREEVTYLPSKEKIILLSTKMPLSDINGDISGIVGNTVEITYLKKIEADLLQAKEAAEAASRAKTEFIANMSHDIRTPLTGVIGLSNILQEQLENPEYKQGATLLSKSGEQLLTMLNEILDDIRADTAHESDIFEENFDLYKCIQDLIELESPTTASKQLGLAFNIQPDVPQYIISDRKKIHHILLNLLGNAIKFTQKGHITVEIKCLDRTKSHVHLQFGVADTGIGIPEELQKKVFERFFRIDPSYKGQYEGYGLGLHIVQSYVSLLGGHVALSSQKGIGTTFYFDVNCGIGENETGLTRPHASQSSSTASFSISLNHKYQTVLEEPPSILFVEDDPIALIVIENLAKNLGLTCLSAKDGETALELAKSHDFKLIITDLGLPGMSGMSLAESIREWEHMQHKTPTAIIGLSAHVQGEILNECMARGMNGGFSKPMTKDILERLKKKHID